MNKKLYMSEIAQLLRETDIIEQQLKEILYQAKDVVEQFDDSDLVEKLGTPQEYMLELLEMNNIEYKIKKKHYEGMRIPSFIIMGIGVFIIVCGVQFLFEGVDDWATLALLIVSILSLSALLIYKQKFNLSTVLSIALILYFYNVLNNYNGNFNYDFHMGQALGGFVILIGYHIFTLPHYYRKQKYGFVKGNQYKYNPHTFAKNSYTNDDHSINVDMHFGEKYIKVTEGIKNINVNMSFGSVKIDATDIINDTYIDINGKFGDVKIDLPFDAKVVDSTSISFGGNGSKDRHINGDGVVVYIRGNYKFGSISY